MKIEKKIISELLPADYNPRKNLQPGDKEYEKLKKSITEFDYVDPVIWNKQTGHVVGGHQRLKVLQDLGYTEIQVSVVDITEAKEKALNIALNKISGDWDTSKLSDLLAELQGIDIDMELTGFDLDEIEAQLCDIEFVDSTGDRMSDSNYGDVRSDKIPMNIMGIGGMIDRDILERVKNKLISKGCDKDNDNGQIISEIFLRWLIE